MKNSINLPLQFCALFAVALFVIGATATPSAAATDASTSLSEHHEAAAPDDFSDLRTIALPIVNMPEDSSLYHDEPIDLDHPLGREPLVDLDNHNVSSLNHYARSDGLNAPYYRRLEHSSPRTLVREGVARRLAEANRYLEPYGAELVVLDGHRSVEVQKALWKHFLNEAELRMPGCGDKEKERYALKFCSSPERFDRKDPRTWPTHTTGGAIDVTLRLKKTGETPFMGTIFDDASTTSRTDHFERLMLEKTISKSDSDIEALRNRRLLYWAMHKAGFRNFPTEWWHFDYGNQMWLRNKKQLEQIKAHQKLLGKSERWSVFMSEIEKNENQPENEHRESARSHHEDRQAHEHEKAFYGVALENPDTKQP